MVAKTKRFMLLNKSKEVIGIRVETARGEVFDIPIADVRRDRLQAESIEKAARASTGSKYFKPSYSVLGKRY